MTETASTYEARPPEKEPNKDLQQIMLKKFMKQEVMVHLVNGIRITGQLTAHDRYTILLNGKQLIFKHAITTIAPYLRDGEKFT